MTSGKIKEKITEAKSKYTTYKIIFTTILAAIGRSLINIQ
jgi:hypothetical protein